MKNKTLTLGIMAGVLLSLSTAKCKAHETHEKSMTKLVGGVVIGYVAGESFNRGLEKMKKDYKRRLKEADRKKKERESKKKKEDN